ncbi:DNA topoisomerase I [Aphelenchoides besseyi]|nr:DNA topoisomerase I [Aphelenchoides besseyi]
MAAVAQQNGINGTVGSPKKEVNGIEESDDETPWAERIDSPPDEMKGDFERPLKVEPQETPKKRKKKRQESSDEEEDYKPEKKKSKKSTQKKPKVEIVEATPQKIRKAPGSSSDASQTPKKKKKQEEEEEVWRWWEEEKKADGVKWNTLEHKGPLFAPGYEPVPSSVKFKYDGKEMKLSIEAEEVASFYAKMLDHEYTSKQTFNQNFFKDWRKVMTSAERDRITDLSKCDFRALRDYFASETEKRKAMTKEEKQKIKEEKEAEAKIYGFAFIDGHKQKIGNFRIEPPGLFRGRGDHPKMGKLKKRIQPEDVIINCSKGQAIPEAPVGHKWKEVRHDNTVTWLCSWSENVLGNNKYIMLNPSSKIKGEKDYEKFETARKLKGKIDEIRKHYTEDLKSDRTLVCQRAVAMYFIDKLALRAGNEKDTDEAADTVGCCSLRCEHVTLHKELDGQKYVVEFDFLGKDSIRYQNAVPVEKQVFKRLKYFKEGGKNDSVQNKKGPGDALFDHLDTSMLNSHLRSLMPGLTAKVFRTYNASHTLQEKLNEFTNADSSVAEKMLAYNRANRAVAVLCNHQRSVPKTHEKSMENLEKKIKEKADKLKEVKKEAKAAKGKEKEKLEKKKKDLSEQLRRLKIQRTDRDENKQIALGTSKLNYLDPRISVAWCKKYDVPINKVFNKTQREKFRWAIDMATEDYEF